MVEWVYILILLFLFGEILWGEYGGNMTEIWFLKNNNNAQFPNKNLNLLERTKLRILLNRNITTIEQMKQFFLNPLESLPSAKLFNDYEILLKRLLNAKNNDESVIIVGDYDVDGIMSTSILMKVLKKLGLNVSYKIPNRVFDGYGINKRIIDECKLEGATVIITVDNGIQAFDELAYAKELGLDVFITDHHELKTDENAVLVPECIGVINPHNPASTYPFKLLCGAGIAYITAIELLKDLDFYDEELDDELLGFAAIATVCDVVDLVEANRTIVYNGLLKLRETRNIGLRKLIEISDVNIATLNSYHLGFVIGPRFNSSGRLETATIGIELLLTDCEEKATDLAKKLDDLNEERKEITEIGYREALDLIDSKNLPNAIVIYLKNIHESVAGIIAGRIKENFYRPTIVFTDSEDFLKGSGRSVDEFDIFSAISQFSDLCLKFGGHKMACGLSISKENLNKFTEKLNVAAEPFKDSFVNKVYIDGVFPVEMTDFRFLEMINAFKPFGKANPNPRFADTHLRLLGFKVLGKNRNVIKLFVLTKNNNRSEMILFETEEKFLKRFFDEYNMDIYKKINEGLYIDTVYYPNLNDYNGKKEVQIVVTNYRYRR